MSQPDELEVWYGHRQVGTLWRNPVGLMGFRYHPEWIETRLCAYVEADIGLPYVTILK